MQSKSMREQARQYEDQARVIRQQSSANEDTMRRRSALEMGEFRASAAESGFDPASGSLLDLQARNAGELELDILTERYKSELQAIGSQNEGASLRAGAKNAMKQARVSAFMAMTRDAEKAGKLALGGA